MKQPNQNLDYGTEQPETLSERLAAAFSSSLYAIFVIALSGGMLLVNAIFCLTVYAAMPKYQNAQIAAQIGQFFFFIVPVLLMVLEWHLLDRIGRLFTSDSQP